MINLLPPETKQAYHYAERNVGLLRWAIITFACIIGVGVISSYGWLTLEQSISDSNKQAASLESGLEQAKLTETNAKVTEVSNNFKLVEKVLSQQILFSKLLKQMATALPSGASLSGLNIAEISSGSALDVTVDATDYTTATQVQVNLADPDNQIFAKADIQNISCDDNAATDSGKPCKITLRTQFANDNPFLFINQKQARS
jgi:hypothetical protein